MSFTKGKEFTRQIEFIRDRVLSAIRQHLHIFERKDMTGALDNPVPFVTTGKIDIDLKAFQIQDGLVVVGREYDEDGFFKVHGKYRPEDCETIFLIKLLSEIESTQWKVIKKELAE